MLQRVRAEKADGKMGYLSSLHALLSFLSYDP